MREGVHRAGSRHPRPDLSALTRGADGAARWQVWDKIAREGWRAYLLFVRAAAGVAVVRETRPLA